MRRKDRHISNREAFEILKDAKYGVLSMCTPDEQGYGIPISFALTDNAIYFHCAKEGAKLDYLRRNNKVSFCVVGSVVTLPSKFGTTYESAIVSGITQEVEEEEKYKALMSFLEKYSSDYIEQGKAFIDNLFDKVTVVKLSIESITGKARKQ